MGSNEAASPTKAEKTPSTVQVQNQPSGHAYPDWAAMQAYYGSGMIPPAYFGTTVAPPHAPHPYMWAPQPILPPFGPSYAAIYPPGGVYPHPGMPLMAAPLSMAVQSNMTAGQEKGPTDDADGVGNGPTNGTTEADGNSLSNSGYSAEGSNYGSDENNVATDLKKRRKRRFEGTSTENLVGALPASCPAPPVNAKTANAGLVGVGTAIQPGNSSVMPHQYGVPSELVIQNERVLKKEKRKQSNRESARRSRLKKQAEIEELATNVESLSAENANFRSEISQLTESSHKLRLENTALMEKLKFSQSSKAGKVTKGNKEDQSAPSVVENFLSMMNNNLNSFNSTAELMNETEKSRSKLCQLLEVGPTNDTMPAS